jgi:tRNA(Ile)-lysidine synthase
MAVKLVKPINHKKVVKITNQDFEAKMKELRVNSDFALAVSGGPDSLALMHLSKRYALNNNINLTVISIDHGIRKESSKEIVWLKKIAKKNKINFYSTKLKKKINGSNTLSKARTLRYEALSKYCNKKKIKFLFTAHHLDDEIENFLMRLIRGSGVKGLSSLKAKSRYKNTKLILVRPLLEYSKKSLIAYLSEQKQNYIYDRTNYNNKYDRSRIRKLSQQLIHEGLSKVRFKNVLKNLKNADNAINATVRNYLEEQVKLNEKKIISFRSKEFINLPEEIQHRVLVKLCRFAGKSNKVPRSRSIQELINSIVKEKSFKRTLNSCTFVGQKGVVNIQSESNLAKPNKTENLSISKNWSKSIEHY